MFNKTTESKRKSTPGLDEEAPHRPTASSSNTLLTVVGITATTLSLIGVFFGYGVALGLSTRLGGDPSMWYASALDLFALTGIGINAIINRMANSSSMVERFVYPSVETGFYLAVTIVVLGLAFIGFIYYAKSESFKGNRNKVSTLCASIKLKAAKPAHLFAWLVVSALTAFIFPALTTIVILFVLACLAAYLFILPLFGALAGQAYADDWVIGPDQCILGPRAQRVKVKEGESLIKGANCVEIFNREGHVVSAGVLIFSPGGAKAILYRPTHDDLQAVDLQELYLKTAVLEIKPGAKEVN